MGYPVCLSVCICGCCGISGVISGPVVAQICPICGEKCALACTCFSPGTMVVTGRGPLAMERITSEDRVLSQVTQSGEVRFGAVQTNMGLSGSFVFTETYVRPDFLKAKDKDQGEHLLLLNVTGEHPVVRLAEKGEDQGDATLIEARNSLGARLPLYDLERHRLSSGRVRRQTQANGAKKHLLFTEHCNIVLANGLVVPTACAEDSSLDKNKTVKTLNMQMFSRQDMHLLSV